MKLCVLVSACAVLLFLPVLPTGAQGSDYPFQTQTGFSLNASVAHVDPDRDRVVVNGDDGKSYTLDTYRAAIVLLGTKRAGQTGDLVEGMRVHITGSLVSGTIVETDRINVLPFRPPPAVPTPRVRNDNAPVYNTPDETGGVTLRGTVEDVDDRRGTFVLRIVDHTSAASHTRTVRVTSQTDLSAYGAHPDRVPVRSGDRVEVAGIFAPGEVVDANTINPVRASRAIGPARRPGLTGPVVGTSDRLRSRDIKVHDEASGRDVTVHVPRGIPILRDGHPLSVHDLGKQDVVLVDGAPDGESSLRAVRIDVVGDVRDDVTPSTPR